MATVRARELYNGIAEDYSAIKSNEYKRWIEETTFLRAIIVDGGDGVRNQSVLDLGCGSGHFCRLIQQYEPKEIHGLDVSDAMVDEAKRLEKEEPAGIAYYRANLLGDKEDILSFLSKLKVNVCVAAYLLPYASNVQDLQKFCSSAAKALRPGGRFVSVTSLCTDAIEKASDGVLASDMWGFSVAWDANASDGMLADVTLLAAGRKERVTFPNHLWSKSTVNKVLLDSGFEKVEWLSPTISPDAPEDVAAEFQTSAVVPVGYFVATLAK